MIAKNIFRRKAGLQLVITAAIIILAGTIGFIYWTDLHQHKSSNMQISEEVGTIHTMTGQVTGTKPQGLADAGDYLYINKELIGTSNKESMHAGRSYDYDISSIKKNDHVEVRFIQDTDGYKSLNCDSCYIKKTR